MDPNIEQRINRVLQQAAERRRARAEPDTPAHERQMARDRVLSEIPRALERLKGAIAEINDSLSGSALGLKLGPVEQPYSLEASFTVFRQTAEDEARRLVLNVNHDGKLSALIGVDENPAFLKATTVFAADRPFFEDVLVSLLEAP